MLKLFLTNVLRRVREFRASRQDIKGEEIMEWLGLLAALCRNERIKRNHYDKPSHRVFGVDRVDTDILHRLRLVSTVGGEEK